MNLQLALFILGGVLIALVFAISRYSDKIELYRKKLKKKARLKHRVHSLNSKRSAEHAPVLGESSITESDQFDAPLFDFESDSITSMEGDTQNGLVTEVDTPEITIRERAEPEPDPEPDPEPEPEPEPEPASAPQEQEAPGADDQGEQFASLKAAETTPEPSGPFTSLRQIDYWVKLSPASPVTQANIISRLKDWERIQFPIQIHALTQEEPHWVNLTDVDAATMIVDVVVSYQLLEGGQAATVEDLSNFDQLASVLGQELKAEKLMMASPEQALQQSQRLEAFYHQSHGALQVSVCAPEGQAFMGKLVETSAKQQGLDFLDGEYVRLKRMASESIILYRMCNNDASTFVQDMSSTGMIQSVRFTMEPALSRTPGRDAKEMLDAVKAFASRVKGDIRIPGTNEFHQEQLLNLRNRVSKLEQQMIDAGLEPGSLEVQRIFS